MIRRRHLLIGAAALAAAPALARKGFRTLFNGRDLTGWARIGDADWTIADGAVSASKGGMSFLLSEERFRDFELRAEFWVSEDANSGIFIRCSDPAAITDRTAYEVNIFDRRPDPSYGTGAIVNVASVSPMPKAGGRWNVMAIRAAGDRFDVTLNGQATVTGARDATHREGPIALQYGSGTVRFRRVEARTL